MVVENCSREELLEYINTIKQLEIQRCTLDSVADEIAEYRESLGYEEDIRPPVYQETRDSGAVSGFIMAIVVFVIALVIGFVADDLLGWLIPGASAFFIIAGIIIAVIICIASVKGLADESSETEQNKRRFDSEYATYQKRLEEDRIRVEQELQMIAYCEGLENQVIEAHNDTVEVLEQLYAKGDIYEKYRFDITAICMFSEYLESKRCNTLIGHEGAYTLFEHEKMLSLILYDLEEIKERLEEIKQSQYMIYQALIDIQERQDQLIGCVNSMVQNQYKIIQNQKEQSRYLEEIEYNSEVLKYNDSIRMVYQLH